MAILIENTEVYGFRAALRAMRNPMDSWNKSDSNYHVQYTGPWGRNIKVPELPVLGDADLKLAHKLIRGGTPHRKFLRQIIVWVDFTLPRYIWQELDTYKVATVRNSCSTMHKLGHRDLIQEDFAAPIPLSLLNELNQLGEDYRIIKDYNYVRDMKNILPEGFLQKST